MSYYLHRIENHQDNTKYYTDELIKDLKKEVQNFNTSNLALLQLKYDVQSQIGMSIPNKKYHHGFYYISDFNIFSKEYMQQAVNELKNKINEINNELLKDIFQSIITNYDNGWWCDRKEVEENE